jgi:carbon storage regulator
VTVTVIEVRGSKVRLGFTGPASTPIHRQEVYDAIYPEEAPDAT